MRKPIDLHGAICTIRYPSSIYSLEAHEFLPHERFCHNVLRVGVEALHEKNLAEQIEIEFPAPSERAPAWIINANIQSLKSASNVLQGFKICFPELLPTLLLLFSHALFDVGVDIREPSDANQEKMRASLQRFLDVANEGIRAYRDRGLASAIREIYESGGVTFERLQEIVNDFDSLSQSIANHEIAHAYVGQLHAFKVKSHSDAKAFAFLADLTATYWLFQKYVLLTPDSDEYRKIRGHDSHASALQENVRWLIRTQQRAAILMAIATAQASGTVSLKGGIRHPTGIGRLRIQMLWLGILTNGYIGSAIGDEATACLASDIINASRLLKKLGILR